MIPKEITEFIGSCIVATVCCVDANMPYCFNCYYAFIPHEGLLIYKSSLGTRHESIMNENKQVAGTIIPEQVEVSAIRGVQFEGVLQEDNMSLVMKTSAAYYLRFPFAMTMPGKIYAIEFQSVKFTDNTKDFGHKQHWAR